MSATPMAVAGAHPAKKFVPALPLEPRWGLAFLALLLYLVIEYTRLPMMYPVLEPLQLGKVSVVLAALALLFTPRQPAVPLPAVRLQDVAMVLFITACLLSALTAQYSDPAWEGFANIVRWGVIYFLLSRILTTSWRIRIFALFMVLLNFKLAQYVVRDYFTSLALGRTPEFLSAHGVGAGTTGFFGNPGDLGVAMCVVWPLAGTLLFVESKRIFRLMLLGAFGTILMAILLCGSRGALLGAAVATIVGMARNPRKLAGVMVALVLVMSFVYFLPGAMKKKSMSALHPDRDETAAIRLRLWDAGWRMFLDHPTTGVGMKNFPVLYYATYAKDDPKLKAWVPHSIYVESISELGVVGSGVALVVVFLIFRTNGRTRKRLREIGITGLKDFDFNLSIALDLALVGFLVSGAFLAVLFYPHLWILLGLSAALHTTCARRQPVKETPPAQEQKRKYALAAS